MNEAPIPGFTRETVELREDAEGRCWMYIHNSHLEETLVLAISPDTALAWGNALLDYAQRQGVISA